MNYSKSQIFQLALVALLPITCLFGYYLFSVPISNLYTQKTVEKPSPAKTMRGIDRLAPLEQKLIAIQRERNLTKETRTKNIIAKLFKDRNAGKITNEQLDKAIRDDSEQEADYLYKAAERLADQADLSKTEKSLLSTRVPFLMDIAKEDADQSRLIEEKAQKMIRAATLSNKKLLEESEKNSFDVAAAKANDKVNMLSAEINSINREATIETIKMHEESAVNPLNTGFIKGRSFLITQKKTQKTIAVYEEQQRILEALLLHPYASKSLQLAALNNKIAILQEKEDLSSLELAALNAEDRKAIARDSESAKKYYRDATYQLQKAQIEAESARHRMASEELESRWKSAVR